MWPKVNTFEQLNKALSDRGVLATKTEQRHDDSITYKVVHYEYHLESACGTQAPLITVDYGVSGDGWIFRILSAEVFPVTLDEEGSVLDRGDGVSLVEQINDACHLPRCMSKTFDVVFQNDEVEATLAEIIETNLKR